MTIGKSKKKGKKGAKKKTVDSMSRKEWYDFRAPTPFETKPFGKTCITRTIGTKIATEVIKGRVVEVSLADLKNQSDHLAWRKIKLQVEDVEGNHLRTSFYGMDMTKDQLCRFIRKWHSVIEGHCEVKTIDGYVLRLFCIGFTKKQEGQISKTAYTQRSQAKRIRRKMIDILTKEASTSNLTNFVKNLITDSYSDMIIKATQYKDFPLGTVLIRKVKMLNKPKFDSFINFFMFFSWKIK